MNMQNFRFLLLLIWSLCLSTRAAAQEAEVCATGHLRTLQRQAITTPAHVKRMNQYDVTFYKLDLHLERNSTYIAGNVTTAASIRVARLDTFAFELHPNFVIDSVVVNGVKQQSISRASGDVSVRLQNAIAPPTTLTAVIYYRGTAPNSGNAAIGNGYSSATANVWGAPQVSWSLSEPYAAYEWWPVKQVLTDKADSLHVFVTTSADNKVGSNGLLTRVADTDNGKKRHEWKSRYPINYYLISVAVSNYDEYLFYANPAGAEAPVPILNYIYPSSLGLRKSEIDRTGPFLEHFSELFSLYPFAAEKYGHSMAPMGGGMEHQTMTTQSTFTFELTAHELAHQWFGNNVTCASWTDIWLNEGFASYAEYLAYQQFMPASANNWMLNAHAYVRQQPHGSVYVPDTTSVSRIFDFRLSYKKGAAVVHLLRYVLNNDELFFRALRNYQQQYRNSTATTADLQRVFEQTSGLNLDYFFEQWYRGQGYPIFGIAWNQQNDKLLVRSTQQTSSSVTPLFTLDVEYRIRTTAGDTLVRVPHMQRVEDYTFRIRGEVLGIDVDPANWIPDLVISSERDPALSVPGGLTLVPEVYPNPVQQELRLSGLPFAPTSAEIFDGAGRGISLPVVPGGATGATICVAGLPAGYYILQLSDSRRYYRTSFIKVP